MSKRSRISKEVDLGIMPKKRSRISKEDNLGIMSKRSRISKEDDLGVMSKRSRISKEDDLGVMSKRSRISKEDDLGVMSKRSRISKEDDLGVMSKRSRISKEDDLGVMSKRSRISKEDDLGVLSKKRSRRISQEDDLVVMPKRSRISKEVDLGVMSKRTRRISKEDDLGVMSKRTRRISKEDDLGIMSKKGSRRISKEVLPVELVHVIQSLLPLEEGGRTCILSKSWQHAWYTLPTLKLMHPNPGKSSSTQEIETKFNNLIHTTLQRYHIHNTPIQSFHFVSSIFFKYTLDEAQNWIRLVVSKSCLRHLSLDINIFLDEHSSLTFPDELFSSKGLHTIHLTASLTTRDFDYLPLRICSTNVINCVSLRVLDLDSVFINQDLLNNLLSTCSLLEKIKLTVCAGFNNIKVKNLLRLTELDISSFEKDDLWEINNVPSLCSFSYRHLCAYMKPVPFQMDSLTNVTQLSIEGGLSFDESFFDTLGSKFHVLESLTLLISFCELKNLVFTSASLKWLTLTLYPMCSSFNVQVYAPKLLSFIYNGRVPSLLFRTTPPKVKLTFWTWESLGHSYFVKIWEALNLSSKFDIYIGSSILDSLVPLNNIDVDDLRRRVSYPVRNVELELQTRLDEHAWEQSRFFDALFLICHPSYIRCRYHVIRKTMERNMTDQLKEVLLKNPHNGNWEALTTSSKSDLHTFSGHLECKLIWFDQ